MRMSLWSLVGLAGFWGLGGSLVTGGMGSVITIAGFGQIYYGFFYSSRILLHSQFEVFLPVVCEPS